MAHDCWLAGSVSLGSGSSWSSSWGSGLESDSDESTLGADAAVAAAAAAAGRQDSDSGASSGLSWILERWLGALDLGPGSVAEAVCSEPEGGLRRETGAVAAVGDSRPPPKVQPSSDFEQPDVVWRSAWTP